MELLYNMARMNSYDAFKNALIDEIGVDAFLNIKQIADTTNMDKFDKVIDTVANHYSKECNVLVTYDDVKGNKRDMYIMEARQMSQYFLREFTNLPFQKIADIFNKDHATIMHSCRAISDRIGWSALIISTDSYIELNREIQKIL